MPDAQSKKTSARGTGMTRRGFIGGTAGAGALAVAGAGPGATAAYAVNPTFRVASFNLNTSGNKAQAKEDLNRLSQQADLIGLNEVMGFEAEAIQEWADAHPGWNYFRPRHIEGESRFRRSNAVMFRRSVLTEVAQGAVFGSKSHTPNFDIDERWITWRTLRHEGTGAKLTWLQTHMDPAVQRDDGGPRAGAENKIDGNRNYMNRMIELAKAKRAEGQVLVGGDWNVCAKLDRQFKYWEFPWSHVEHRDDPDTLPSFRSTYTYYGFGGIPPTTGRYIDYIAIWLPAVRANRAMTFRSHDVLTGYNSDHKPIKAVIEVHRDRL